MPGLTGVEFLERAHALHPHAKRILLDGARLHDRESDHLGDDARPDRLPPRQAVGAGARALPRRDRVPRQLGQRQQRRVLALPAGCAGEQPPRPRDPRPPHPLPDAVHVPRGRLGGGNRAARRDRADRVRGAGCRPARRPRARRPDRSRHGRGVRRRDAPRHRGVRRHRHRSRPGGARGLRVRRVGGPRDARRRAARLRRSGRSQLAHPQRPRLHVGHQRPGPHLSGLRAGLAVRGQDDLRPGGLVTAGGR